MATPANSTTTIAGKSMRASLGILSNAIPMTYPPARRPTTMAATYRNAICRLICSSAGTLALTLEDGSGCPILGVPLKEGADHLRSRVPQHDNTASGRLPHFGEYLGALQFARYSAFRSSGASTREAVEPRHHRGLAPSGASAIRAPDSPRTAHLHAVNLRAPGAA